MIHVIHPYQHRGVWVFDDPSTGLKHEAFVMGMPDIIETLTDHLHRPERGFTALFSGSEFPNADARLRWAGSEMGGNWYVWPEHGLDGWLCPALFKYFDAAPESIYIAVANGKPRHWWERL